MNASLHNFNSLLDATRLLPEETQRSRLAEWLRSASEADPTLGRRQSHASGERVYAVGSVDRSIFLVVAGEVALILQDPEAGQCMTARLGPGSVFGESAFASPVRPDEAVALTSLSVLQVPLASMMNRARDPAVLQMLLEYMAQRMVRNRAVLGSLMAPYDLSALRNGAAQEGPGEA